MNNEEQRLVNWSKWVATRHEGFNTLENLFKGIDLIDDYVRYLQDQVETLDVDTLQNQMISMDGNVERIDAQIEMLTKLNVPSSLQLVIQQRLIELYRQRKEITD